MGGIIAPIVAQSEPVAGIMVYGTVFRPLAPVFVGNASAAKAVVRKVYGNRNRSVY
jgi:hypothetical protein